MTHKRVVGGGYWTSRKEGERLEQESRNAEVDRNLERKAEQSLKDYALFHPFRQTETEMNPLDTWMS